MPLPRVVAGNPDYIRPRIEGKAAWLTWSCRDRALDHPADQAHAQCHRDRQDRRAGVQGDGSSVSGVRPPAVDWTFARFCLDCDTR